MEVGASQAVGVADPELEHRVGTLGNNSEAHRLISFKESKQTNSTPVGSSKS